MDYFLEWSALLRRGGASQGALVVKNPPASAGDQRDVGLIPGSGRSPGGGNGNSLQYSCLKSSMGRGAWEATVHGVTESNMTEHACMHLIIRKSLYLVYSHSDSLVYLLAPSTGRVVSSGPSTGAVAPANSARGQPQPSDEDTLVQRAEHIPAGKRTPMCAHCNQVIRLVIWFKVFIEKA